MFNRWRASTIVVMFQFAVGAVVYAFEAATGAETKSFFGPVVVVVVATLMGIFPGVAFLSDDLHAALLPAFLAALAAMFWGLGWQGSALVSLFLSVGVSYCIAAVAKHSEIEPWPLVFIAALPLGIGTVFGGTILLWRRLYESANIPFA